MVLGVLKERLVVSMTGGCINMFIYKKGEGLFDLLILMGRLIIFYLLIDLMK
jgi:hypothetical protein